MAGLRRLLVHWALALVLLFVAAFVGIAATGPTVAAAERTVVMLGVVDAVLVLAVLGRFAVATREFASGPVRAVWTLVCGAGLAVAGLGMFVVTVMGLDR